MQFHAIGFQGVVQDGNSEYVHHLVLTAYTGTPDCGLSCAEWFFSYFPSERSSAYGDSADSSDFNASSAYSSSPSYTEYYSYFEANNITIPDFCFIDSSDVFPWAPGSGDLYLPDDIGFFFGNASGGYTSLGLNTHYDNPNGDAGNIDSSGVRVYYTDELRPIEMGVRAQWERYCRVLLTSRSCVHQHEKIDHLIVFSA